MSPNRREGFAEETECSGEMVGTAHHSPGSMTMRGPGWVGLLLTWHKMNKPAKTPLLPTQEQLPSLFHCKAS